MFVVGSVILCPTNTSHSTRWIDIRIFGSPILFATRDMRGDFWMNSKNTLEKPCSGLGTTGGMVRTEKWALAVDATDITFLAGLWTELGGEPA